MNGFFTKAFNELTIRKKAPDRVQKKPPPGDKILVISFERDETINILRLHIAVSVSIFKFFISFKWLLIY